ncbi:hypothetical protein CS053_16165 [Rhodanobacter glycinis]|uniref:Putative Flp pilus-assembly TadG-like N-terminal domain-containing protein n=2 Tax=Rhodanobacter glycinis TaxID=582702 RepID=A0A5B9E5F0_9GAMM|nr:hypothetical protein CS053_16165 [Rhodanobacter glycinis]
MQAPTPHPGSIQPGATSIRRQHGSMAIAMMLMLLGLISILGIVEVGYLYWAHRDAQKVADLAALSGAQQLPDCAAATTAASNNATTDNSFKGTPTVSCGAWGGAASPDSVTPASSSTAATNTGVKVVAQMPLTPFFGFAKFSGTNATAVAINSTPTASFSVGSSLAKIDPSSPLNNLIGTTLGTSVGLQLLSYKGITNANISLLDLIKASPIDIGTVHDVLNAPITVSDFLTAYLTVLQNSPNAPYINFGTVKAGISAIEGTVVHKVEGDVLLGDTSINLGSILNVNANTDDPNVALNTDVSALDILNAVVLAADSKNAVALPATSIDVPGVATVNLSLSIIEPPQIGIGPVGTTAHTAQIRLLLDVSALPNNTLTGGQSLLDLPLYVEVAPADATIASIQCNVPSTNGGTQDTVVINGTPGLVNAFLGKLTPAAFTNTTTPWATLAAGGTEAPLISVSVGLLSVLGISVPSVVQISASASAALVTNPPAEPLTFNVDPTVPISQQSDMTQTAGASSSSILGSAISSLLGSTTLQTTVTLLNLVPVSLPLNVLTPLLGTLSTALNPVLSSLDSLLVAPLLQTVGLQIGTADVNLRSVNCNAGAQLVY